METMSVKIMSVVAFVAFVVVGGSSWAAEKPQPAVTADTKDAFTEVASKTRDQMKEGGRYSKVTAAEKSKVDARLDEMGQLFDQRGSVAQMSGDEKVRLFNAQEEVNSILAKRDNDRLICRNEAPIGSHLPVKTCKTVGEIERQRQADSHGLEKLQKRAAQGPGATGN